MIHFLTYDSCDLYHVYVKISQIIAGWYGSTYSSPSLMSLCRSYIFGGPKTLDWPTTLQLQPIKKGLQRPQTMAQTGTTYVPDNMT